MECMGAFTHSGRHRVLRQHALLIGCAATNEERECVTMATHWILHVENVVSHTTHTQFLGPITGSHGGAKAEANGFTDLLN